MIGRFVTLDAWSVKASHPPARNQHYRDLHINALPPGHRAEPGHQALWLWRTLRAAELAGLDPARVLAEAIAERDLAGSRDVPAVIDARILNRLGSVVPLPPGSWSAQVPASPTLTAAPDLPDADPWIRDLDAGHRRFAARLADRQSLTIPAEDPDYGDLGLAFPAWTGSSREAILQPPKPQIRPSARVLERAPDREADIETGE